MYKNSLLIPFGNAKIQKKERICKSHSDALHFLAIDKHTNAKLQRYLKDFLFK